MKFSLTHSKLTVLIFSLVLLTASTSLYGQNQAIMTFDSTHHHFGKIKAGKKAVHKYKFVNTGNRDLKISEVKTTCGCTVAKYPKDPIPPGGKGKIEVAFDTKDKNGPYVKGVNIHHNGKDEVSNLIVFITVKGEPIKEMEFDLDQ